MSEVPHRFEHIRRSTKLGRLFAVIGAGIIVGIGAYSLGGEYAPWAWFREHLLAFGLLAAACLLIAMFIFLWNILNLLLKLEGNSFRSYGVIRDVHGRLDAQGDHVTGGGGTFGGSEQRGAEAILVFDRGVSR